MEYFLSEYGVRTEFSSYSTAIMHCRNKKLTNGEHGRLWIYAKSRNDAEQWLENHPKKYKDQYMMLTYKRGKNQFIWSQDFNKWINFEIYFDLYNDMADALVAMKDMIETDRFCNLK